ncbi:hypothetical protein Moror_9664, partial [Moniliophthora roreri MCA 2997]
MQEVIRNWLDGESADFLEVEINIVFVTTLLEEDGSNNQLELDLHMERCPQLQWFVETVVNGLAVDQLELVLKEREDKGANSGIVFERTEDLLQITEALPLHNLHILSLKFISPFLQPDLSTMLLFAALPKLTRIDLEGWVPSLFYDALSGKQQAWSCFPELVTLRIRPWSKVTGEALLEVLR